MFGLERVRGQAKLKIKMENERLAGRQTGRQTGRESEVSTDQTVLMKETYVQPLVLLQGSTTNGLGTPCSIIWHT